MDEQEQYTRKAALLKRALLEADDLDAKDAERARAKPVFELGPGQKLAADQYDGMEGLLGDNILPTDWDPETEDSRMTHGSPRSGRKKQ